MTVTTKEGMTARLAMPARRLVSRISRCAARYPTPSCSHSAYASSVFKTEYQVAAQRIAGSSWCLEGLFPSDGQGRQSCHLPRASCWVELNSQRFDAVAEASELPDHSRSACSFQPFACGLATFLVADPSAQDYPDQPTKPMCNCPNGLIVSQAW